MNLIKKIKKAFYKQQKAKEEIKHEIKEEPKVTYYMPYISPTLLNDTLKLTHENMLKEFFAFIIEVHDDSIHDMTLANESIRPSSFKRFKFKNCIFINITFPKVEFTNVTFVDCTFTNCIFDECNIFDATFSHCTFNESTFTGTPHVWSHVKFIDDTIFLKTDFRTIDHIFGITVDNVRMDKFSHDALYYIPKKELVLGHIKVYDNPLALKLIANSLER